MLNQNKFSSDVQKVKQEIQSDLQSANQGQSGANAAGSALTSEAQQVRQEIQNDLQSNAMSSSLRNQSEAQKVKQEIQRDLQS